MNAITCPVILTRASTRTDGSLGLSFATPELKPDEKVALMELCNKNLKMLLQPIDEPMTGLKDVKQEFDRKTPSQRLRAVLFVEWQQMGQTGEFEEHYRRKMEYFINSIKNGLNPV